MPLTLDLPPVMSISSSNARLISPSSPTTTHSFEQAFGRLDLSDNELGLSPVTVDASTSTDPISTRTFACRNSAPLTIMETRDDRPDDRPAGNLHPSAVDCKWWKQGYCARATSCYFKHDPNVAGLEVKRRTRGYQQRGCETTAQTAPNQHGGNSDLAPGINPSSLADNSPLSSSQEECSVCNEVPSTYGLLVGCDHSFCLECIRIWRATGDGDGEKHDKTGQNSNWKQCPVCRTYSKFVIPSSIFPTPVYGQGHPANPAKEEILKGYLANLKKIPCRYFEESINTERLLNVQRGERIRAQRRRRPAFRNEETLDTRMLTQLHPKCRFGNECHYAHLDPITKEPFIFSTGQLQQMRLDRARLADRLTNRLADRMAEEALDAARVAAAREALFRQMQAVIRPRTHHSTS